MKKVVYLVQTVIYFFLRFQRKYHPSFQQAPPMEVTGNLKSQKEYAR